MGEMLTARFCKATKVPWRIIEKDAILVNLNSKMVLHLNESAAEIWKVLDGQRTVGAIIDHLCAEFEVSREDAERDALEFLGQLQKAGAIERR